MKNRIIIGSRESKLAVRQSETVLDYIRVHCPEADPELLTMKTAGDRILDRTLDQVGGKGLFVKELDLALREKKADIAVHSLKDVPMQLSEDLPLVAFSKREDPRDVLVLPKGVRTLSPDLPIGSSSLRRQLQLKKLFPNHEIKPVRGNLQTRLRKLDEGEYGALVLAAAGLIRLGLQDRISRYFSIEEILPAAGQGIIAVQGRREEQYSWLAGYDDPDARMAALCERAYVTELAGGCTSPVCAHAWIEKDQMIVRGLYYEEETGTMQIGELCGPCKDAQNLGRSLARLMKNRKSENGE